MNRFIKLIALLLCAALCAGLFTGCATKDSTDDSTQESTNEPTDESTLPEMGSAYGENDPTALDSYGIINAEPGDSNMRAVAAVNADGEAILTNAQLQFYFWEEFYQIQDYFGEYYLSLIGLSTSTPLSEQSSLMENYSWEQYLVESLTNTFSNLYALSSAAKADGYTLDEENLELLDYYTTADGGFVSDIAESGYSSLEEYLAAFYGNGVSIDDYREYLETYLTATAYYDDCLYLPVMNALTEEDVNAYYAEHKEDYEEDGVLQINNATVRHILIAPEETEDESEDATNAALEAALNEAHDVLELWLEDPTVEHFAELADEYSADGAEGGLYEDFAPGAMITEFNDWCFDESRQPGDYDIVKTDYGYHIIYFIERTETRAWYDTVVSDISGTSATEALTELKELYPVKFDYTQVRVFDIIAYLIDQTESDEQESTQSEEPSAEG